MPSDSTDTVTTHPSSGPLQDRSNVQDHAATELEKKDNTIAHLQGLLDGLTKKRSRGRKRRVADVTTAGNSSDTEQPAPSKRSKKSNANAVQTTGDFVAYGRIAARLLGPFVDPQQVLDYGIAVDGAESDDEDEIEHDAKSDEAWDILCKRFPGFRVYVLKNSNLPQVTRAIAKQLGSGMEALRAEDTAALKKKVDRYLREDGKPLELPLANLKDKALRGTAHEVFAVLITPIKWAADQSTWLAIAAGDMHVTGGQLPRFIFPLNQVFPVGVGMKDAAWGPVFDNTLKGEVVLRSAKCILMGPESALEGDGYHKGKPGHAAIMGLTTFTRRVIAWIVTQVYFALSSKQEWYKTDGDYFDYEHFFWTIYGLFDNEEWGKEIIALWDRVVLGKNVLTTVAPAAAGPSALEELKAARAERAARAAAAVAAAATPTAPAASI